MTRLNLLLLVAVLISAMYLVQVSHETRRLFAALDSARVEERTLDTEFERLRTEKQTQATPSRVERVARDKLAMRGATPAVTRYLDSVVTTAPGAAMSAASAVSAVAAVSAVSTASTTGGTR